MEPNRELARGTARRTSAQAFHQGSQNLQPRDKPRVGFVVRVRFRRTHAKGVDFVHEKSRRGGVKSGLRARVDHRRRVVLRTPQQRA